MNLNPKVNDYFQKAPKDQLELLEILREIIHKSVDGVKEEIKWGFPVFGCPKDFAYLRHNKEHVTIGFYNIEKIQDPDNLLQGTGSTMKHLKIKSKAEIDHGLLKVWLKSIST